MMPLLEKQQEELWVKSNRIVIPDDEDVGEVDGHFPRNRYEVFRYVTQHTIAVSGAAAHIVLIMSRLLAWHAQNVTAVLFVVVSGYV